MNTKPSYILLFRQEWSTILSSKHDFFTAIAQYHQARLAKDKGSYGEGVARFQLAEKLMATVAKNSMGLIEFKVCCALKPSYCHVVLNMITCLASCHAFGHSPLSRSKREEEEHRDCFYIGSSLGTSQSDLMKNFSHILRSLSEG